MAAPHPPTDAEPWTSPPPGSTLRPPPRPRRGTLVAVVAVVAAMLIGVAVGALLRNSSGTVAEDPPPNQPAAEDVPVEPPDPADEQPDADEEGAAALAQLRASDRYLAIAEHQRARSADSPIPGGPTWEEFRPGEGQYANKEALWDQVVAPIRDDALLAGEPYSAAMWNEDHPAAAYIPVGWHDSTTGGRGDAFTFAVRFVDPSTGEPVERVHAVLVATDDRGGHEVIERMAPFDLRVEDATDFQARAALLRERVWDWVQQQPVSQAGE